MTDERLERALSEAITDLAGTSAPDYLDGILERTSRTRQRPWWTFPGRYLAMTPTLKFATAATMAFVLGVGASMLILPQSSGPTTGPAAPEPSPTAPPSTDPGSIVTERATEFVALWEIESLAPLVSDEPRTASRYRWRVVESSDPRLGGAVFNTNRSLTVPGVIGYHGYFEIENDGGAWTSDPLVTIVLEDGTGSIGTSLFSGSGDYDGLTAVVEMAYDPDRKAMDVRGFITGWPIVDAPEITAGE